jgi:serine/threonine protein kinase/tetratricopeptide (TPR) repeat protein
MDRAQAEPDEIFCDALELASSAEQAAYLDRACGGDTDLRRRVQRLLEAHAEAEGFLAAGPTVAAATIDGVAATTGTDIGPYKLLEQIGEGGFGVVFRAEQQEPLRRQVALKVLKPGMDTRQVVARFEAERQALALMDHPNIARVFDGGETDRGRPYFAMELVKGVPITDYCDQAQLTPRKRLELFVPVCQAVQHAHQKGIIHRDLKPSNVLVTLQDGAALVKVIDFGIAKALGQQLSDKTLFTGVAQMIGTPLYMSPEQAALSNIDVDTRSDVYALGVLLYELLTGTTPFEERLKDIGYDEMRRIIREEEPPRPSTRISTLAQARATIATDRKSDPRQLSHLFRGELDWIVMKCLEKDRNRRYESASALARDVQRYLTDEPVLACPPSGLYRFRKFARRNRGRLAAAGLSGALLVATVAGLAVSNVLISREKEHKDQALRQAQASADEADRQRRLAQANLRLARKAVDDLYTELVGEFNNSGRYDQHLAQKFQQKTLAFYQEFARLQETDPELRLGVARAQLRVAQIHGAFWQNAQAEEAVTQAIARLDELQADRPDDPASRRELAGACGILGEVLKRTHRKAAAEPVIRRAIGLLAPRPTDSPAGPKDHYQLVDLYWSLAQVLPPGPAEEAIRTSAQLADQLVADSPGELQFRVFQVTARARLGQALVQGQRHPEGEATLREALALHERLPAGTDRRLSATIRLQLAAVLEATGRPAEAEADYRKAVEVLEQVVQDQAFIGAFALGELFGAYEQFARLVAKAGRTEEAIAIRRRALDALGRFVDGLPQEEAYEELAVGTFSQFTSQLKWPDECLERERVCRGALAAAERLAAKLPGRPTPQSLLAYWHASLGSILTARGLPAEAADEYRQARDGYWAVLDVAPNRASTLNNLAWLLTTCPDPQLRDPARALDLARKATELAPQYGYLWNTRGVAHYRVGDWEGACAALEKSVTLYARHSEHARLESFSTFFLALAHARLGHAAEARRWYDRAVRWMDQYQPEDQELRRFRAEAEELVIRNK